MYDGKEDDISINNNLIKKNEENEKLVRVNSSYVRVNSMDIG